MVDVKSIGSKKDYPKSVNGKTSSSTRSMRDVKHLVSKADSYTEIVIDSSGTEVSDVKTVSNGGTYTEKANHEMGSSGSTSLYAKIASKGDHINIADDLLHSGSAGSIYVNREASRKRTRKKRKNKKLAASVILNPGDDLQDAEIANGGRQDVSISKQYHLSGEQMEMNIASSLSEKLTIGNGDFVNDQNLVASTLKDFSKHHKMQPVRTHATASRKMLLILDVNGLLADIIHPSPKDFKSDIKISRQAIFKRPFLDDFLVFCFERFDVAIWSSRTRKILDPVVEYLLGDLKKKLVFLWDLSHCTNSRARSLENHHKFIVFKKLRKIWEANGPIASENGNYDESNTLLLDDSPYKALLNPKHTGIFPFSYSYKDINDNSLGPDGDLRVYLEGLATTENVKMYVDQHPFGQRAIDETSPYWGFYREFYEKTRIQKIRQAFIGVNLA